MLTYSNRVSRWFLNPTSDLNRFRLPDYRRIFEECFKIVEIEVQQYQENEYEVVRARIRREFKTADPSVDAVT